MSNNPIILIFMDWFDPAFKAGGPIRSIMNFVDSLHRSYTLKIFTADRDINASSALPGITTDIWQEYSGHAYVFYSSQSNVRSKVKMQIKLLPKNSFVYLNSMFSYSFMLTPLIFCILNRPDLNVIINPRGMLKPNALKYKWLKKRVFLAVFKLCRLQKKVVWHFTEKNEVQNAMKLLGKKFEYEIIPNFPIRPSNELIRKVKIPGELKVVFIGRVHPIKNLKYGLDILSKIKGNIHVRIYGLIEDMNYWAQCRDLIDDLESSIRVEYVGPIHFNKVGDAIVDHHLLLSPTSGENFGHNIFESLAMGRPVLISDQTPWRDLSIAGIGWDVPLSDREGFIEALKQMLNMDQNQFDHMCINCLNYASDFHSGTDLVNRYKNLFSI